MSRPLDCPAPTQPRATHAGHYVVRCRGCDVVIRQCRCIGPKPVRYETCAECSGTPRTAFGPVLDFPPEETT